MNLAAHLKNARLFAGLDRGDVEIIAGLCHAMETPARTPLFRAGDPCDRFYVVAQGRVKVFKESEKGREQILHIVHPGQSFAEAAMFAGSRFPASAETLEDSTLIVVPKEPFVGRLRDDPELCLKLLGSVTLWLRRMIDLVEDLALKDVQMRLSGFLVKEAAERGIALTAGAVLSLGMSKSDLAKRLGTVSETLSRALYRLQKEGAIAVQGRDVEITDPDRLAAAAGAAEQSVEY